MTTNSSKQPQNVTSAKSQNLRAQPKSKSKAKAITEAMPKAELIKVGVDVGLSKYALARQVDGAVVEPPQMKSPAKFREWILKQKEQAKKVVVCYEAGFLGFELARWLQSNGIQCLVMAPICLDEGNKRVETDKINARDILCRLDRYLHGNERAMTVCRIPTRQEELARHETRQRQQLLEVRQSLQAQGRSLCWQFGHLEEGQGEWWQGEKWIELKGSLEEIIVQSLERYRALILAVEKEMEALGEVLKEKAMKVLPESLRQAPRGMGWLSLYTIFTEVMDFGRFTNRGGMGCFSGLVPSEGSTGLSRRQGSITKVGNPVLRKVLVEMAWRMKQFQHDYHAIKKWIHILGDKKCRSASQRKKAIVAVARVLGVDLWRIFTQQTTAEALGLH